jgi:hypothetical protein
LFSFIFLVLPLYRSSSVHFSGCCWSSPLAGLVSRRPPPPIPNICREMLFTEQNP